jgi:hypothetical protein
MSRRLQGWRIDQGTNMRSPKSLLAGCALSALVAICAGCAPSRYYIADNFAKQRLRRVGVLVNRVASRYPGDLGRISLDTDYSRRVPRKPSSFNEEQINVYIEDDARLHESVPNYPAFQLRERGSEEALYFGNLSPELSAAVQQALVAKGYEFVDLRAVMGKWSPPFTEMTVGRILAQLGGIVDAVLIVHYVDVQQRSVFHQWSENYGNISVQHSYGQTDAGFSTLHYTMSVFDVSTRERVLVYHEKDGIRLSNPEAQRSRETIVDDLSAQVRKWVGQALP